MTDRDFPTIDTSGGASPPNTVAERGTIALAVLALVGGTLIALGNLLGGDGGPAVESANPVAHATPRPSRSPRPTPVPLEVVVIPGTPPSAAPSEPEVWQFSGWIRALVDQPLWTSPDSDRAETTELLHAGEIRYADEVSEEPGWLQVRSDGGPPGFIVMTDGQTALVQRIMPEPYLASGEVWSLAAGPNGFVATGYLPGMSDRASPLFTAFSPDGAAWQMADLPIDVTSVAWGPAGWLAVGWVGGAITTPTTWVFRSEDGLHWDSLGAAPGLDYAGQLVGSESGYLMDVSGRGYGELSEWFSSDGLSWRESDNPLLGRSSQVGFPRLASVGSGFYAWIGGDTPVGVIGQAFSPDGRTWRAVADGPTGVNMKLTTLGDRIIATVTDPDDGFVSFWTGAISGSTVAWDPPHPDVVDASRAGYGVSALISDGRRALAFVWERATDAPSVWTSTNGTTWTPSPLPVGAFGGIPRLAAGGSAGMVVVGSRYTVRGSNPLFWREVRASGWEAEAPPLLPLVPSPSGDDCPGPLEDIVGFMAVDPAIAVACFGDAPVTFRAWSVGCPDCQPESSDQYVPQWLANPTTNPLFLQPIKSDAGSWRQVVTAPDLAIDPGWTGSWIEVTGHFDDPAAVSCRWSPTYSDEVHYTGQASFAENCRQQFVVTAVRVVDGP
ncbi:MAG: hypothetical protein WD116_02635 [Chloroflexota bacterium]